MNTAEVRRDYFVLQLSESFKNETKKPIEMQVSYINAMGYRSNSFKNLYPGETITRTQCGTIIFIFTENNP